MKSTRKFRKSRRLLAIASKLRVHVGVDFGFNDDMFVMLTRDGIYDLRHDRWLTREVEISVEEARRLFPPVHPAQEAVIRSSVDFRLWGGTR